MEIQKYTPSERNAPTEATCQAPTLPVGEIRLCKFRAPLATDGDIRFLNFSHSNIVNMYSSVRLGQETCKS
ncbi:hypothetical protein H5410_054265 [Solanum commersonii]|uniref:Uncharacterized protein n=1 Tax=Solanum commersonii TaxID=4109 RepID=A0A9J5X8Q2_SOLCO|nr:hypothetical protein H5410_054265 [Solanum commersonii]